MPVATSRQGTPVLTILLAGLRTGTISIIFQPMWTAAGGADLCAYKYTRKKDQGRDPVCWFAAVTLRFLIRDRRY